LQQFLPKVATTRKKRPPADRARSSRKHLINNYYLLNREFLIGFYDVWADSLNCNICCARMKNNALRALLLCLFCFSPLIPRLTPPVSCSPKVQPESK
jgi:hypothetical protein